MKIPLFIIFCLFNVNAGYSADNERHSADYNQTQNFIFRYGMMYCGKSTEIFQQVNAEGCDNVFLVTAKITQTDKEHPIIHARNIGDIPADSSFSESSNFTELFTHNLNGRTKVIIDECHFLRCEQVGQISEYCKKNPEVTILLYGLLYDAFEQKFASSGLLEEIAGKVEEVKSMAICPCCEEKAIRNVRINKDNYYVETNGEQIATTAQGFLYISVCSDHASGDLSAYANEINEVCSK